MKYLIFDTETTGFPKVELDWDNPDQARICQIAWVLLDEKFQETCSFKSLIRSDGKWTITQGAQQAHGISQLECDKNGLAMDVVLGLFLHSVMLSEKLVAHNIGFDQKLIDIECCAFQKPKVNWNHGRTLCTMQTMTPICKLVKAGQTSLKWPKLQEAYLHCFGEEFKDAHDALADVRATARILKWLGDNRHIS